MRRLIIFLIRKRLGLRQHQKFRFTNQKTEDVYYFTDRHLMKIEYGVNHCLSGVSLNWLLDDDCDITTTL